MTSGSVFGNANIGMYVYATNTYALIGRDVSESFAKEVAKTLQVKVIRLNAAGTNLTGVFFAGNTHCLLVPEIMFPEEIEVLEKEKIPYAIIQTHLTALGNNIIANDAGAVVHTYFDEKTIEQIERALKVPAQKGTIARLPIVGSVAVVNKNGCLIHRDVTEEEKKKVEETLKTTCEECTVNTGNPYVKSGIICNDHSYLVGEGTRGPEIQVIHQTLTKK